MTLATRPRRNRSSRPGLEALEGRALLASAGALDPSFGSGYGTSSVPLGVTAISMSGTDYVNPGPVVAIPGGKIEVGVTANESTSRNSSIVIARFNADGSLDSTFGTGGLVSIPGSLGSLFVQGDGKTLVVTGSYSSYTYDGGGNPTFVVARLNLNGSLDTSYGTGGVAEYPASTTTSPADRVGMITSAVLQTDGDLVLAGTATDLSRPGSPVSFAAVRLDTDGVLDPNFGQAGTVNLPLTVNGQSTASNPRLAQQADGKLILAGEVVNGYVSGFQGFPTPAYEVAVLRLDANGSLDTSYGGPTIPGVTLIPPSLSDPTALGSSTVAAIAIQPTDGKLVLSGFAELGTASEDNTFSRLNTDGSLDPTFGTGGQVKDANTGQLNAQIVIQADGKIVLSIGGRLNPDGSTDTTYVAPMLASAADGQFLALQADGKILESYVSDVRVLPNLQYALSVARILPTASTGPTALPPAPNAPFNVQGQDYSNLNIYDPTSGSFIYQRFPNAVGNFTIPFGISGVGQTLPAVADYAGTGTAQLGVYLTASGVYAIPATSTSPAVFQQFGSPGLGQSIPVPADYEGNRKADLAVYLVASGTFAILPSNGSSGREVQFGSPGAGQSIPAPADYYGTGQADIAVYLASQGAFAVQDPTGATAGEIVPFGKPGLGQSIPVPGDYDGSGHVEFAVFVPSTATFYYRPYGGGPDVAVPFGVPNSGELPVVGDYDGSGRSEFAVYDPSSGFIAYRPAGGGADYLTHLGTPNSGAIPVATPAGVLPEFAAPGSGGGHARALSPPSTGPSSSGEGGVTRSAAVPSGPALASVSARAARLPINQAAPDPLKLT